MTVPVTFEENEHRPLKFEAAHVYGARPDDPLGQRAYLGLKCEGGLAAAYLQGGKDKQGTEAFDVAVQLCEEIHARCFQALASAVLGRETMGEPPKSAAEYMRRQLVGVELERDEALKRAKEAETRLDELRRLFQGGDNGPSDRDVQP